mgnify:FL=1
MVEATFTATPKDLDQLKTQQKAQVNQTAYTMLAPSDWRVIKALETQGTVDPAWTAYRTNVRSTADASRVAIDACTIVEELAALTVTWPVSPDAPIQTEPATEGN